MIKLKSLLMISFSFLFLLVSCSINKEEANVFVENFVNAIDNANASKIKQCLETDEQKIIKIFKVSDVNKNIASNPT